MTPSCICYCAPSRIQMWLASIPDHFRYSEENLHRHITMHETSSNTGAWCFCFVHALHPCYLLDLYEVSRCLARWVGVEWFSPLSPLRPPCLDGDTVGSVGEQAEGTFQAQSVDWIRDQLKAILNATGNRAKNSILCKCQYSAASCVQASSCFKILIPCLRFHFPFAYSTAGTKLDARFG